MKKILFILLCVVFVIGLVSCSPEEPLRQEGLSSESETETNGTTGVTWDPNGEWVRYEDVDITISLEGPTEKLSLGAENYFYQQGCGTLLRYNKMTGEVSTACADPLCSHNDQECDLYTLQLMKAYAIRDNTIYYLRYLYKDQYIGEIWQYDLTTARAEKVFQLYGLFSSMVAIASGCYFTDSAYEVNESNEKEYTTVLYFVDLKGNVTKLATIKGFFNVVCILDGKLLLQENGGDNYTSDLYGRGMTVLDPKTQRPIFENYQYYMTPLGMKNGRVWTSLMRKHLETGEEEVVLENCAFYTVLGDRIYYLEYQEEPIELGSSPTGVNLSSYVDHFGGKLYSMDFNGEDKRLVIDDPNIYFYMLPSFRSSPLLDDRYMGIPLLVYLEVPGGIKPEYGQSMLVLDTKTGEYKVGVYEP